MMQQLGNFEQELSKKEALISELHSKIEGLQKENKKLNDSRIQYENFVDLKVASANQKNEEAMKQMKRKYEIELENLEKKHKKLDDDALYARFKLELKTLRDTFYEDYKSKVLEKVEKEKEIIYKTLKAEFEEEYKNHKEELYKKLDISLIQKEIELLNKQMKYQNQGQYSWLPEEDEMQKFVQLMLSNGNWKSYRLPNCGNVYQVVNAWFSMHKCKIPSFCRYWVYDVVKEGNYDTCARNMITHAKLCPYVEWLNPIGDNYDLCHHWMSTLKTIPPYEMIVRSNSSVDTSCQYCIQYAKEIPPELWRKQYNSDSQLKTWWTNYWPNDRNPF